MTGSNVRVRWNDLVSLRSVYSFTIQDALDSLPALTFMALIFLAGFLVVTLIKRLADRFFLSLIRQEDDAAFVCTGPKPTDDRAFWKRINTSTAGNRIHFVSGVLYFVAMALVVLFAASSAGINLSENAIGLTCISLVITYTFQTGLQRWGDGQFFFLKNTMMAVGEYWLAAGNPTLGGRVAYATSSDVAFHRKAANGSGVLQVVPMNIIVNTAWDRVYHLEVVEDTPFKKDLPPSVQPSSSPAQKPYQAKSAADDSVTVTLYPDGSAVPFSKKDK